MRAPLGSRWLRAGERIAARHGMRRRALGPLERVLVRRARPLTVVRRVESTLRRTVTIAPRVALRVVVVRPSAPEPGRETIERTLVRRLETRTERSTRALRERLEARRTRSTSAPSARPALLEREPRAGSAASAAPGAPPELVLARTAAPATPARDENASPRGGSPGADPSPGAERPLDVGHLTDKVLSAIDRRLVAERERLGRP